MRQTIHLAKSELALVELVLAVLLLLLLGGESCGRRGSRRGLLLVAQLLLHLEQSKQSQRVLRVGSLVGAALGRKLMQLLQVLLLLLLLNRWRQRRTARVGQSLSL